MINYEARLAKLRVIYKERPELRKTVLLQVRSLKKAEELSKASTVLERETIEALF